jgi:hypothetical protein
MTDGLPTDFVINAQIRIAARDGVPITVLQRGDANSGAIILKINRLDGQAAVLTQVRYDEELVWYPASADLWMPEAEADAYLASQRQLDPDSWLLEIEDRKGRHWFPGRIVKL